jgi:hypothetical protein
VPKDGSRGPFMVRQAHHERVKSIGSPKAPNPFDLSLSKGGVMPKWVS